MTGLTFGVTIPQWTGHAGPTVWRRIATGAERSGFDVLWKGDHITFPEEVAGGGLGEIGPKTNTFDLFTSLSFLAGITSEIHVGSNICVVPYRHPVLLVKNALSVDVLSDGRFEFGVGAGWLESEFAVLDVPYDERSERTTEFLELFTLVIERDELAFDGSHHSFGRTGFYPRPSTQDGPPIWVGGESSAAIRRLARFGDGWTVTGKTPTEVDAGRERIQHAWSDYGRHGSPEIAVTQTLDLGADGIQAGPLCGSVDEVIASISEYIESGVTHLNIRLTGQNPDAYIEDLDEFATRIRPSF